MSMMIDMIRDGMAASHDDAGMQLLGGLLTEWMLARPGQAGADAGDKTLKGALGAMRREAEKVKKGNCAVISDAEGLRIALAYLYGAGAAKDAAGIGGESAKPPADEWAALDLDALMDL